MHKLSHKHIKKALMTVGLGISISGPIANSLVAVVNAEDKTPQTEQTAKTPNGLRVKTDSSALDKTAQEAATLGIKVDKLESKDTLVKPGESAAKVVEANAAMTKQAQENAKIIANYKAKKTAYDADHKTWTAQKTSHDAAVKQYEANRTAYEKQRTAYNTAKTKFDKDYASYKSQKAAWDTAKAKYDTDTVNYRVAKAEYDKAVAKYKADLAQYNKDKAANDATKQAYDSAMVVYNKQLAAYDAAIKKANESGIKVNGINPADIKQQLVMGREPQAEAHVELLSPNVILKGKSLRGTGVSTYDYSKKIVIDSKGNFTPDFTPGGDSKYAYNIEAKDDFISTGVKGDFVRVTHDNLSHTYYGNKQISKIEATYSNLGSNPRTGTGAKKPIAVINSDPTDSFWYINSKGINLSLKFYDSQGKQINIDNQTAYLAITSLNATYSTEDTWGSISKTGKPLVVESANLLSPGKAMKLTESSVDVDGTKLVSNITNSDSINARENQAVPEYWWGWDNQNSDKKIWGAGLFEINSNPHMQFESTGAAGGKETWATYQTIIPKSTIGVKPTKPSAPTYKPLGEAPKAPTNEPVAPKPLPEAPKEPVAPTPPIAPKTPDELREEPKAPAIPTIKVQKLAVYESIDAKKEVVGDANGIVADKQATDDKDAAKTESSTDSTGKASSSDKASSETSSSAASTSAITSTTTDSKEAATDVSKTTDTDATKGTEGTSIDANTDKKQIDLNGKTVVAGKPATYFMRTSNLPAGRDKIDSYVITDKLDPNMTIDEKTYAEHVDKSKWEVTYKDGVITFTATKALLEEMNKDTSKVFDLQKDAPSFVGTSTKLDSKVTNDFDVTVKSTGQDAPTTTTSNKVLTKTPKAIKGSLTKTINGKQRDQIKPGDDYKYELEVVLGNVDEKGNAVADNIISDQLEDVVDFKKVESVESDNPEISKAFTGGKVDKDNKFTITGKDTTKFAGETVKIVLDTQLKKDANYDKFTKNGLIEVPNIAQLLGTPVNGKDKTPVPMVTSNTVKTYYQIPAPKKELPAKEAPNTGLQTPLTRIIQAVASWFK